jgi:hypothetical protein
VPCGLVDQLPRELETGHTGTLLPNPLSQPMTRKFQLKAVENFKISKQQGRKVRSKERNWLIFKRRIIYNT